MGYYARGDPGIFDWIGSAATAVGGAVASFGKSIGLSGPSQVIQRMQETGNPLGSFITTAKERGWGGAARDVITGLSMAAGGGLFGAAGLTAAQAASQFAGLFTSAEPPAYGRTQPEYEDMMTSMQPPAMMRRGYSTPSYWEDSGEDAFEPTYEDYYGGPPQFGVPQMPFEARQYAAQEAIIRSEAAREAAARERAIARGTFGE